jgi:hypothetical protein
MSAKPEPGPLPFSTPTVRKIQGAFRTTSLPSSDFSHPIPPHPCLMALIWHPNMISPINKHFHSYLVLLSCPAATGMIFAGFLSMHLVSTISAHYGPMAYNEALKLFRFAEFFHCQSEFSLFCRNGFFVERYSDGFPTSEWSTRTDSLNPSSWAPLDCTWWQV